MGQIPVDIFSSTLSWANCGHLFLAILLYDFMNLYHKTANKYLIIIGGFRGRVAGVATPPPLVGKFLPKSHFLPFLGLQPPFRPEWLTKVVMRGWNPLSKNLDPPMIMVSNLINRPLKQEFTSQYPLNSIKTNLCITPSLSRWTLCSFKWKGS